MGSEQTSTPITQPQEIKPTAVEEGSVKMKQVENGGKAFNKVDSGADLGRKRKRRNKKVGGAWVFVVFRGKGSGGDGFLF